MDALEDIIQAIDTFLTQGTEVNYSEHQLIDHLSINKIAPFDQFNISQSKDLFSAHFLCMHSLYHLQNRYYEEKTFKLQITLTRITRTPYHQGESEIESHDAVKQYYLEMTHYFETSEEEVNNLLDSFWKKFLAQDDKHAALEILELTPKANQDEIKQQYRRLAQKHHPDKGGDINIFNKINAAKELLNRAFSG